MKRKPKSPSRAGDPLWYKDAVIYEVHVRAFCDSNGDGTGDFRGLADKLDYLQDLGVNAIWLLPFFPSPWRDDGYDIADYAGIHPAYGSLRDFHSFLREAHRRGLRVIAELVVNHTSDQHPWFRLSRKAPPGSPWRDFYVWSDSPDKYPDARVIFKDFESSNWTWDPLSKLYYWHRFYSHQPDLNYDSPRVRRAIFRALDSWLDAGVDGLRLDAVPYLFQREGTNCENLPETHAFLKELRRHVDSRYHDRMLLAEANQWPEDAVTYFGDGDECHMAFHFPLMPRLFMAARMEDRFPIVDILEQTPTIPDNCQWALFLRNHDELTLEMVTDEERDYMYRVYAHDPQMRVNLGIRRRLAPLLGNQRRLMELMNCLLFTLPGTPVIYYGDEIGMGDNIYLGDRNGVRTPMQWSADRNAGFSRANPQRLFLPVIIDPEYHYEALNVEAQQSNPHSLLWWMKRLIALRKDSKALSRGSLEFLNAGNRRVIVYLRRYQDERVLVVANLSRFAQPVQLELPGLDNFLPEEMFGRVRFPPIRDSSSYCMTLGPHGFHLFSLTPAVVFRESISLPAEQPRAPELSVPSLQGWLTSGARSALERHLPAYLENRRWFRSKTRTIRSAQIADILPVPETSASFLLVHVEYGEGDPELYALPVAVASGDQATQICEQQPDAVVARLRTAGDAEGLLCSALWDPGFCHALLFLIGRKRRVKGERGELLFNRTRGFRAAMAAAPSPLEPRVLKAEQTNSSIIFGDRFILKLFRKLEEGLNPDLEIGRFLTEKTTFRNAPPVAGSIEYQRNNGPPITVAILQGLVANEGDAWQYTIDNLSRYFERVLAQGEEGRTPPAAARHPLDLAGQELHPVAFSFIQNYLEDARLLGDRTAEFHLALLTGGEDPDFSPEPFTDFYRHGLYHGMIGLVNRSVETLRQSAQGLSPDVQEDARLVLELEGEIRKRLRPIRDRRLSTIRIRHHGDYHLGQVLFTGRDFVLIDFEGEPARALSERRLKRSPLRDVAGMLRSFHYASYAVLFGQVPGVVVRPENFSVLEAWARFWYVHAGARFLEGYLERAGRASFLPASREELRVLLDAYLMEKAVYEVGYELNNRPQWVRIPLRGILDLLEAHP